MRLLLDTHALIWVSENDPQLSQSAKKALELASNTKFVSIATLWEMAIKINIGKLKLAKPLSIIIKDFQANDIQLLSVEPAHILLIENLPLIHRDPFDRILIAQAISEGFTLVSNEVLFDEYSIDRLW
jgi:PIN domain nuclease of toxin-antitoxin system